VSEARRTKPLTETEWRAVLKARCNSKRGLPNSRVDQSLCERAFAEDRKRYSEMDVDVFNETVPFGSTVRLERKLATPPESPDSSPTGTGKTTSPPPEKSRP